MKIFAQSDLHANKVLLKDTIRKVNNNEYNLYLGLGDFIDKNYFATLITNLKVDKKACIQGNWDMRMKGLPYLEEFNTFEYDGFKFILAGSSMDHAIKEKILKEAKDVDNKNLIICTHVPPHGIRDKANNGRNIGAPEFKEIIDEISPLIWFCGHIHEARGVEEYNGTTVINASVSKRLLGYEVEIENGEILNIEEIER